MLNFTDYSGFYVTILEWGLFSQTDSLKKGMPYVQIKHDSVFNTFF